MRRAWTVAGITPLCVAGVAAVALAAHPQKGARYTGNSGVCAGALQTHHDCVFVFRVSTDGKTLRFVKNGEAIDGWGCNGGGGEALFNSSQPGSHQIPVAHIASNGTFYGSGGHGSSTVTIKGRFTGSGKTAVLKFFLARQGCHTAPLNLVED